MNGVLVDREALLREWLAGWDSDMGPYSWWFFETEFAERVRSALALPAQEQALTAEVWVHDSEHAELLSVTGCVSVHVWEDLKTDLTENSPELPEGAYIVPVDRDNTDPTGMASGAYTYYLDWKRAAPDRALEVQG